MYNPTWTLLAFLLAGCTGAQTAPGSPAASPGQASSETQARLPQAARPLLTDRMYVHGEDLRDLNWAILFLDRGTVQEIAERISEAPRFAPPLSGDATDLNASIPREFFALQNELAERARLLSSAAVRSDIVTVSAAYGQLVETCVRCHDRYLEDPPTRALTNEESGERGP